MINIKPVSELRNYNKILKEVESDKPVFLTKNGRGKYAIIDIEEYDRFQLSLEIIEKLKEAENGKKFDNEEIMKKYGF